MAIKVTIWNEYRHEKISETDVVSLGHLARYFISNRGMKRFLHIITRISKKIIINAVKWARPTSVTSNISGIHFPEPLEKIN